MKNRKMLAFSGILLLALSSIVFFNSQLKPVSAVTLPYEDQYTWMGGYLNLSFCIVNLTEPVSTMSQTVMNMSLEYWEDVENFTFTTASPYNVTCPKEAYITAPLPIYSADLTDSLGLDTWYKIRMLWRQGFPDGYGKIYPSAGMGDVDYRMFVTGTTGVNNQTIKKGVTSGGSVVDVDSAGAWIGSDGTSDDPALSMWLMQTLFINTSFYLGGQPGGFPPPLIEMALVQVNMDSWLTTGTAYCNVSMPGHPLDGKEVTGTGEPWDSEYESAVFASCGSELNQYAYFEHPTKPWQSCPINISYVFCHKHMVVRSDLLQPADASMDGYVNLDDLEVLSEFWLGEATSKASGIYVGQLEDSGEWAKLYRYTKLLAAADFTGDEFVNLDDLEVMSAQWLAEGWIPPYHM